MIASPIDRHVRALDLSNTAGCDTVHMVAPVPGDTVECDICGTVIADLDGDDPRIVLIVHQALSRCWDPMPVFLPPPDFPHEETA